MARPGRNVVDMVVARLPAPGDRKSSGARKRKKDDEDSDVGLESAVMDFAKALGLHPKDVDVEAAVEAARDLVTICSHDSYEGDEDSED